MSHDGNVLNGLCSFRTNISPCIKTLDQKRTPFSSGHAVETVFVQIPAENAPHVARALSSRIQERQNAFQIIWTWLLFWDAFGGQNANFIRTGTILYIELSSSKINKKNTWWYNREPKHFLKLLNILKWATFPLRRKSESTPKVRPLTVKSNHGPLFYNRENRRQKIPWELKDKKPLLLSSPFEDQTPEVAS